MRHRWEDWPVDDLLDTRICDLGLKIDGTWLEALIAQVRRELAARDLRFRPHFWLADEFFTPDEVTGAGIPFYLAHRRLMQLERKQMFEVEGGSRTECLRILRHEVGHAIDNAYRLSRRKRWRDTFGSVSKPYPESYRPNPRSKRFVQHLDGWYAQSHPAEDFAETFAVWLAPRSDWKQQYAGWPALRKLETVDELMRDIAGKPPKVRSRAKPYSLPRLRHTVRTHYQRKRAHYTAGYSEVRDSDLLKLFSADSQHRHRSTAYAFLKRHRRDIRERVATWTGEYEFTLDQVLKDIAGRCKQLKLRLRVPERQAKVDFALMLAVHTIQYLHLGDEWHAL
jgi:hypothetical protein